MTNNVIYTKSYCPYCKRAKHALNGLGIAYKEIEITNDVALQAEMRARSGRNTIPQIFLGDHHIGGSDDLAEAIHNGQLEKILTGLSKVA